MQDFCRKLAFQEFFLNFYHLKKKCIFFKTHISCASFFLIRIDLEHQKEFLTSVKLHLMFLKQFWPFSTKKKTFTKDAAILSDHNYLLIFE